jgi:hypothetical protein
LYKGGFNSVGGVFIVLGKLFDRVSFWLRQQDKLPKELVTHKDTWSQPQPCVTWWLMVFIFRPAVKHG